MLIINKKVLSILRLLKVKLIEVLIYLVILWNLLRLKLILVMLFLMI